MFKNLRTGTKLYILCGVFLFSVGVPAYGLVAEKQIAIGFARKELVGSRYLGAVRELHQSIMLVSTNDERPPAILEALLAMLAHAEASSGAMGSTADLATALGASLRQLWSSSAEAQEYFTTRTLQAGQILAQRIGDDSNLTLDPDLDSYYLQNIVTKEMPSYFGRLSALHWLVKNDANSAASAAASNPGLPILEGLLRSTASEIHADLVAAYRGNAEGRLPHAIAAKFATMLKSTDAYLASLAGGQAATLPHLRAAITDATAAWLVAHGELDRLLHQRIDGLLGRMQVSLALIGAFVGLSLLIAALTYRGIVRPLQRLESVASAVSETKDYSLRAPQGGQDEIGRVTAAINDMLSELAAARVREIGMQAQFARDTRLTTMGEMAASIAHEINQPLAAIVANTSAGLRWLRNTPPDLGRVDGVLHSIARDGDRAAQVISGIRGLFNKNVQEVTSIDMGGAVQEVHSLLWEELERERIIVDVNFSDGLAPVLANRVQLQQVISNLVMNAVDAMREVVERPRQLRLQAKSEQPGEVVLTVEDSGLGIAPGDADRIFDAFFSTKRGGLGLGLAICRSIVEAHGGKLWATVNLPHGTKFHVQLPTTASRP